MGMRAEQASAFRADGAIAKCRALGGAGDDSDVLRHGDSHDHPNFPTSGTNSAEPQSSICTLVPTRVTRARRWLPSAPRGMTILPVLASCWTSGSGTDGPLAATMMRSKGAWSLQP